MIYNVLPTLTMPSYTPSNLPAGPVMISDDGEAMQFIEALGFLDKLPSPSSLSESAVSATYDGHPTHWIVCLRFEGYSDPTENGFSVQCFPKNQYSLDHVQKMLKLTLTQYASETDPAGPYRDHGYKPL